MTPRTRLALQKLLPHSPQTCEEIERIVARALRAEHNRAISEVDAVLWGVGELCAKSDNRGGTDALRLAATRIKALKSPAPRRARKAKR